MKEVSFCTMLRSHSGRTAEHLIIVAAFPPTKTGLNLASREELRISGKPNALKGEYSAFLVIVSQHLSACLTSSRIRSVYQLGHRGKRKHWDFADVAESYE